jgi:hypothetical protein
MNLIHIPAIVAGEWRFHWDNVPVSTATAVTNWTVARQFLTQPTLLTGSGTGRILSLLQGEVRAGWPHPTQETFKKDWVRL